MQSSINSISFSPTNNTSKILGLDFKASSTNLLSSKIAISLSPSSLSTVPLEVEEPTDDCELSWAVYDVINAIRGTVH